MDDLRGMVTRLPDGALGADGVLLSGGAGLPIGTRLGEFELTGLVGEGGFGIVYQATDHLLGRTVAIKEYMPSSLATRGQHAEVGVRSERHAETFEAGRRSFINEARLLAQFDHPALVKVFRFWEANGTAYMAMPYYRGRNLREHLAAAGSPATQGWLEQWLPPLFDALGTMHAAQCYHRDIAPDNILLLDDGRPLLLDFGAARRVIGDSTQALTVILKPGFAPVEQYANGPEMKQGPWTDVYALAAVIYYCATLKAPVPAVSRLMKDTLAPFSQATGGRFSAGFGAAVDRGLSVGIDDRWPTIAAFRNALGLEAGARQPPSAEPRPTLPHAATWASPPSDRPFPDEPGPIAQPGDVDATVVDPGAFDRLARRPAPREPEAPLWPEAPPRAPGQVGPGDADRGAPAEPAWKPDPDAQAERARAVGATAPRRGRGKALAGGVAALVAVVIGIGYFTGLGEAWLAGNPAKNAVTGNDPVAATRRDDATAPTPAPSAPAAPSSTAPSAPPAELPQAPLPPPATQTATAPVPKAPPTGPATDDPVPVVPSLVPAAPAVRPAAETGTAPADRRAGGEAVAARVIEGLLAARANDWQLNGTPSPRRVRIGKDAIQFRLKSSVEGYVYLLMQGTERDHFWLLFPNALDQNNRIRPNAEVVLPRQNWQMVAGGPPGTNRILAIVTPTPRDFGTLGLKAADPFSEFDLGIAARLLADRGAGAFAGVPLKCTLPEDACRRFGATLFEIEEVP